ncbi:MAG: M48 family metallopeptidase, partial [Gammaproteobacteria bacterium]|nr:M48 family metallopeptidase [Gammaproteobacteria bacterium]
PYLQHKDVTGSRYYTGTTGSARTAPMPGNWWILEHSDVANDLGVRDQGFIIQDEQLTELVYGITNNLLGAWPGTTPSVAIFVQGDRSPLAYGAQTTYHGEIFINYGVLVHAESEDELAAVIGHELAHVLLGHGETLKYKKNVQKSLNVVANARDLYAKAEALEYNDATEEYSLDPSVEGKLKQSAVQNVIADRFYKSVHATLFSRGNEHDADRLGLDLLIAAGYSPRGLKASLERMAHSHDLSTEISDYLTNSSLSLLQESLSAVGDALDQDNVRNLDQFFAGAKDKFSDSALEFGKKAFVEFSAKSHPVPEKRIRQITEYLNDTYPRKVRGRKLNQATAARFRQGHVADLLARYTVANQAMEALATADLWTAEEYSLAALTPPATNHPYTRYAAFMTGRMQGDRQAMIVNAESIDPDMLMPVFATIEIADLLSSAGKTEKAADMISTYEGYFGTVADYYPPKIRMSISAFELTEAQQLTEACFSTAPADSLLSEKCARESGILRPAAGSADQGSNSKNSLGALFNSLTQ